MIKPKLIIVDNNLIFRQSLDFLISVQNNAQVIGKTSTGNGLIELLSHLKPDLILIDIDMPKLNGIKVIKEVLDQNPDTEIIAFTMFQRDSYISELIKIGVKKFLLKTTALIELENDIRSLRLFKNNKFFNIQTQNIISRLNLEYLQLKFENIWLKNSNIFEPQKNQGVISTYNNTQYRNLN